MNSPATPPPPGSDPPPWRGRGPGRLRGSSLRPTRAPAGQVATPTLTVTRSSRSPTRKTCSPTCWRRRSPVLPRLVGRRVGEDHQELLASVAPHGVDGAQRVPEQERHLAQHRVAREVAVLVVDALEVVDVDHEHAHRPSDSAPRAPPPVPSSSMVWRWLKRSVRLSRMARFRTRSKRRLFSTTMWAWLATWPRKARRLRRPAARPPVRPRTSRPERRSFGLDREGGEGPEHVSTGPLARALGGKQSRPGPARSSGPCRAVDDRLEHARLRVLDHGRGRGPVQE